MILEIQPGLWTNVICVAAFIAFVLLLQYVVAKTSKKEMPASEKNLSRNKDFSILFWDKIKSPNEALEEMDKNDFRPATGEEVRLNLDKISDIEEHCPEPQRHRPIIALGSSEYVHGKSVVFDYESFNYEEEKDKRGEEDEQEGDVLNFHFVGSHMSSLEISRSICQFAVVKK